MPWGRQWPPNNPSPTPVSLTSVRRRWPVTPSLPRPADPNLVVTTPNPQPIQVAQGQEIVTGIKIGVVVQSLETRDSDNDGVLDRAEDLNGDSNGNSIPDYLERDVIGNGGNVQRLFLPVVFR